MSHLHCDGDARDQRHLVRRAVPLIWAGTGLSLIVVAATFAQAMAGQPFIG